MSVYIHDYKRTPFGKSKGGAFRNTEALELCKAVATREAHDEIVWGCVQQYGEQGYNIARQIGLASGMNAVPAITVNRLCGSSMSAAHYAFANIKAGMGNSYLVGGVEHMGHNPMTEHYHDSADLSRYTAKASMNMGITAELLAKTYQISREEQDALALESHQRAVANKHTSIVTLPGHDADGSYMIASTDECPRGDTTLEKLASLKPVFDPRGSVTAGNSSAISDGAASLVLSSEKSEFEIVGTAVVTVAPAIMGLGPVFAIQKLLGENKLNTKDISTWEINEAFAAQTIACLRELGLSYDDINEFGGAIALGHPLGASGARIIGTCTDVMKHNNKGEFGVAAMCIGAGQGIATLIRRTST